MSMTGFESDPDEARGDFIRHLAERFGVSEEAALSCLGDWLTAVAQDRTTSARHRLSTKEKRRG